MYSDSGLLRCEASLSFRAHMDLWPTHGDESAVILSEAKDLEFRSDAN